MRQSDRLLVAGAPSGGPLHVELRWLNVLLCLVSRKVMFQTHVHIRTQAQRKREMRAWRRPRPLEITRSETIPSLVSGALALAVRLATGSARRPTTVKNSFAIPLVWGPPGSSAQVRSYSGGLRSPLSLRVSSSAERRVSASPHVRACAGRGKRAWVFSKGRGLVYGGTSPSVWSEAVHPAGWKPASTRSRWRVFASATSRACWRSHHGRSERPRRR